MTLFNDPPRYSRSPTVVAEYRLEVEACTNSFWYERDDIHLPPPDADAPVFEHTLDWVKEAVRESPDVRDELDSLAIDMRKWPVPPFVLIAGYAWTERLDSHDYGIDYDGGFEITAVHHCYTAEQVDKMVQELLDGTDKT
jgi:hypothetical protein